MDLKYWDLMSILIPHGNISYKTNYHFYQVSFLQAAVSATFQALRNQSPLAPTIGNIGQSELARRRRRSKPKNEGSTSTSV